MRIQILIRSITLLSVAGKVFFRIPLVNRCVRHEGQADFRLLYIVGKVLRLVNGEGEFYEGQAGF